MRTLMRTTHNYPQSILILALFFIGISSDAFSQEVKLGLAITPNVSWMNSTDDIHTVDGVNGNFGFGLMVDFLQNETLSFSTGVRVFDTGGTMEYLEEHLFLATIYSSRRDFSLKYVEIPLTIKARSKEIGYTTFYANAGCGLGLNIEASAYVENKNEFVDEGWGWEPIETNTYQHRETSVNNDIKLLRASYILGFGVERTLGEYASLITGLNFNAGFLNIYKPEVEQFILGENGLPLYEDGSIVTSQVKGNDRFLELVIGLIF